MGIAFDGERNFMAMCQATSIPAPSLRDGERGGHEVAEDGDETDSAAAVLEGLGIIEDWGADEGRRGLEDARRRFPKPSDGLEPSTLLSMEAERSAARRRNREAATSLVFSQ